MRHDFQKGTLAVRIGSADMTSAFPRNLLSPFDDSRYLHVVTVAVLHRTRMACCGDTRSGNFIRKISANLL